jgi:hypothetical protein
MRDVKAMSDTRAFAELTRADRCDRCGAQAAVRVVLESSELLFCGHHARKHNAALLEIGAQIAS